MPCAHFHCFEVAKPSASQRAHWCGGACCIDWHAGRGAPRTKPTGRTTTSMALVTPAMVRIISRFGRPGVRKGSLGRSQPRHASLGRSPAGPAAEAACGRQHGQDRDTQALARRQHNSAAEAGCGEAKKADRDCLTPDTRALLARLEENVGPVELASTCRPEARMPTGEVSWHARNRAFDFLVPKHVDKRDVMVWLSKNSPGVTMSYRSSPHIHTDTGSFHKVIYNAANHEAGERAVAIWKARALLASAPPLPKPRPKALPRGRLRLPVRILAIRCMNTWSRRPTACRDPLRRATVLASSAVISRPRK